MANYDVTVPATTSGELSLASNNSATMSPTRPDNYAGETYTFTKPGGANPRVDVTATPDSGYTTEAWSVTGFTAPAGSVLNNDPSGNTASYEIESATTVPTPTFTQYFAVTINTTGSGTVAVNVDDGSAQSGSSVSVYVKDGTSLSINNTPSAGYVYDGTSGNTTITAASTITVSFVDDILDEGVSSTDYIGHDTNSKHLLLKVPDYTSAAGGSPYPWSATSEKNALVQVGDAANVSNTSSIADGNDLLEGQIDFLDDYRDRGTSGSGTWGGATPTALTTPPSETSARTASPYSEAGADKDTAGDTGMNAKVTDIIPTYAGWRDHTDGHRITTTRGDKIEVIGGNYKIVSLGRGTGTAAYEMSGGIIIDAMEPPGNTSSVTWQDCPTHSTDMGWQVVSQTVYGNEVERYHGTKREEFYGDKMISVVGSPGQNSTESEYTLDDDKDGDITYLGADADRNLTLVDTTDAYPTKWDQRAGVAPVLTQPDIYESTWASSVKEYTKIAGKHTEYVKVGDTHSEEVHYEKGHISHTYLTTAGESHCEYFHMTGSLGHIEHFHGAKTEFFTGSTTTIGFANRFELFIGLEEQFNLGGMMDILVGGKLEVTFPFLTEGKLLHTECSVAKASARINNNTAEVAKTEAKVSDVKAVVAESQVGLASVENNLVKKI
jgi:hypothetical protein